MKLLVYMFVGDPGNGIEYARTVVAYLPLNVVVKPSPSVTWLSWKLHGTASFIHLISLP